MKYINRSIETVLMRYLKSFPIIGITGPRQSGKSTLLQRTLQQYRYVTFDDPKQIEFFYDDPEGFLQEYDNQVIFDEVQHVPEIFNYLKIAVDNDRMNYGKYVITGSSQFAFMRGASESLAGRIGLLTLYPLQYSELPQKTREQAIFQGSYPELAINNYSESSGWYSAYLDTYINKDMRVVSNIGDIRDFRRYLSLLASNTSKILNMSDYARDIGVTVPTIKHWTSVLEASYIIFLLTPYYNNYGKRIIKSPKVYFHDTGLVSYLTGIETKNQYEKGPMAGGIFENYIISEVVKKIAHTKSNINVYYLRTSNKVEIDLIVDHKDHRDFIEIKKTSTASTKMLSGIKEFSTSSDNGYLLYNGNKHSYGKNLLALPYSEYLTEYLP